MPRARRAHYLITYDVTDDSRRTRLSRLLEGYGDRVQYSVFEAELNAKEVQEILSAAAKLVTESDSLRLYPTCAECARAVSILGRRYTPPPALRIV